MLEKASGLSRTANPAARARLGLVSREGFKNNSHNLPEGPSPQRGEGLG